MMERKFTALKMLFLCIVVLPFCANGQTIVYVDHAATGANDGTSWANAFTDIQAAIDEAALSATSATASQVWVKSGTYYPTLTTDVAIHITLKNNVELIGGFGGTESMLSQRDFRSNVTTLSGNIGNAADSLDNSDVIIGLGSDIVDRVLIDGFHLEGAYSTSTQSGAIHYFSAPNAVEIYNCTFENNYGLLGSALSGFNGISSGKLELINSFFITNGAITGGVTSAVFAKADAIVSNCVFARNKSNNGSGLNIFQGAAGVTNCTFFGNVASSGSGITLDQVSSAAVINCIFWGNTGQAILENNAGFLNVSNNLIEGGFSGSVNTIDVDPLFNDENNLDLAIVHCSPAVDQGVSISATEDILGNPRVFNGIPDLGAVENQDAALSFSAVELQQVSCANSSDGQISVQGTGGSGSPLEYSLDGLNFSSNSIFSNLDDGIYTVTIRDAGNGCEYDESFTITEPDPLTYSTTLSAITCHGDADAVLTIIPNGGSTPYQLSLDGGATFLTTQFSTTFDVEDLGPGTLNLVLVDANNCTADVNQILTVTEPDAITGSVSITEVSCNGASDGSVIISASGGSGALRYSLSNFVSGNQSSPEFNNLSAGTYTVSVRDAKFCQTDIPFTVSEPTPLALIENFTVDVSCNGGDDGSSQYDGNGGTAPYEYSLDGTNFQTSPVWSGLSEGSYTISVKDANACTASVNISIGEPTSVSATLAATETSGCGASDGSLEVTPQGGTGPYVYQIDGSSFTSSNVFSSLSSGTYEVRVVDDNGCDILVTGTVNDPGTASVSVNTTPVACNGDASGSLQVTTSGGTAPFRFILDGGAPQSAGTFNGLTAGTYSIQVQESNGCSQTVSATISEPTSLNLTVTSIDLSCFGGGTGQITASATGGTGGLSYSLDGTTFQVASTFTDLDAGTYTVFVRDDNNCELSETVVIEEPSELTATTSTLDATCNEVADGTINVSVVGGSSPYEYSLDGGIFQSAAAFGDLEAGSYLVTVRDANGCEMQLSETVSNQFTVSATTMITDPLCSGASTGEVALSPSGGSSPYEYMLVGSTGTQTSPIFSGLSSGLYEFIITDTNGCTATAAVTLTDPDPLMAQPSISGVSCNGESDGSVSIVPSGGTSPYEYSIDGISFQTTSDFGNLSAGSYTITVRDANSCEIIENVTMTEPEELLVSVTQIDRRNFAVMASGGTSPYEYAIDGIDFQSSGSFDDLEVGNYTFSARDANGCLAVSSLFEVVLGVENPQVSIYPNPVSEMVRIGGIAFDKVVIYSTDGREVFQTILGQFSVKDLKKGINVIRLYKNHKVIHEQKLIIN